MAEDPHLLTDETNYRMTLQTYLKYMQQLPPQREWMKDTLAPHLRKTFGSKKTMRVLAVGSGSGEVDMDFIQTIVDCGKAVRGEDYSVVYTVCEPNSSNVEFFKGEVEKRAEFKNVTFEWHVGFFEAFVEKFTSSATEDTKIDFAHFVRVFYHIDSYTALNTVYEKLLAKDGFVAVVGENENAFWPLMMIFLNDHNLKNECFLCSGPVSDAYFLPGWSKQAKDNGWKHEVFTRSYNFDVTDCFDEQSAVGNYLIDFAFHGKQSRKTIEKSTMDDFFAFLRKHAKDEEVEMDGVKQVRTNFPAQLGAIIITKV